MRCPFYFLKTPWSKRAKMIVELLSFTPLSKACPAFPCTLEKKWRYNTREGMLAYFIGKLASLGNFLLVLSPCGVITSPLHPLSKSLKVGPLDLSCTKK